MADDKDAHTDWYPPPDKSSAKERFTEAWDFERALKAVPKRDKEDSK